MKFTSEKSYQVGWSSPVQFDLNKKQDKKDLELLYEQGKIHRVINRIDLAVSELYDDKYPHEKDKRNKTNYNQFVEQTAPDPALYGPWVYFEWDETLVHFPPKEDYYSLVTSRNRELVTSEERVVLSKATILVAGLSVGSNVVESLVIQAVGGTLILADMDELEPTNLNRIRAGYDEVGVHKIDVIAKKISKSNPFIKQIHYHDGLNEARISEIMKEYSPDIIIDEVDSLDIKVALREAGRKNITPVLMATDNSDGAILDVERYDLDSKTKFFNGLIPEAVLQQIKDGTIPRKEAGKLIGQYFVGFDNVSLRMIESLAEVGKTIPSWPQLGSAATLSGLLVGYATKNILLGKRLTKDRYHINLDADLDPETQTTQYKIKKEELLGRLVGDA